MPSFTSAPRLTLPPHARRPPSRLPPVPHVITAAGWLLFPLIASVLRLWLNPSDAPPSYAWPVAAFICITAAVGLLLRASWARALASILAITGGLFMGAISLATFYPLELFWWPGALFVVFCAWTLFFTVRLWPDYVVPSKPAA